jgi:hypothetical protein
MLTMKKARRTESSGTGPEHANQEELSDNYGWPQPDFLSTEALQEMMDTTLELLVPELHVLRNRPPSREIAKSGVTGQTAQEELWRHRRRLLNTYQKIHQIPNRLELSRHLGINRSALFFMVRGDPGRYSEDTLDATLKKMNISRKQWDHVGKTPHRPQPPIPEWVPQEVFRFHMREALRD